MAKLRPAVMCATNTRGDRHDIHYAQDGAPGALRLIQYGWFTGKPGDDLYRMQGAMSRPYFLIHFVYAGKGRVVVGDTEYRVEAGQYFVFFPNQVTYYEADESDPWTYYWLAFDGEEAQQLMREAGMTPASVVCPIPQKERVFAALESIRGVELNSGTYLLITGQLYICLHYLTEGAWGGEAGSAVCSRRCPEILTNEYVRMVTEYIAQNYAQPVSVADIARRMGLDRSYLTAVFHKHTGRTIKEYLTGYRLEKVKILLQHEKYSIKRAALECGFMDPLRFSRVFREKVGVTAQEYRKQCRNAGAQENGPVQEEKALDASVQTEAPRRRP